MVGEREPSRVVRALWADLETVVLGLRAFCLPGAQGGKRYPDHHLYALPLCCLGSRILLDLSSLKIMVILALEQMWP